MVMSSIIPGMGKVLMQNRQWVAYVPHALTAADTRHACTVLYLLVNISYMYYKRELVCVEIDYKPLVYMVLRLPSLT